MQGAASSPEVLVAVKDAEVVMLRQQLAQLSADLSRNLGVMAAREAEAEESRDAVASLTALLAEKDALFAQYEEQVAALEALRQKEAAEAKSLQAALQANKQRWEEQLQAEQTKREALEAQLQQHEGASTAQLQSVRQAAVDQAVQHSTQYAAQLEQAAGQRKQLQAQVQELQAALAAKESELGAVQMQLAGALESSKRVQDTHAKAMAAKTGLVAQVQQELAQVQAGQTHANKAHESHISQLISSINEMQQLCSSQAADLQQHAAGQKALQQQLEALQKASRQHEEARSKAEMRRSAMESALQHEVTAHAAVKAHAGMLQESLAGLLLDLQQQQQGAAAAVAQLSAQLSEAQEQMVCAAVSQQPAPQRAQVARTLEEQCQALSTDLVAAQQQAACLAGVCKQLQSQVAPFLPATSPARQPAPAAAASPAQAAGAQQQQQSCMAALMQSLQLQQQWQEAASQQDCACQGRPQHMPASPAIRQQLFVPAAAPHMQQDSQSPAAAAAPAMEENTACDHGQLWRTPTKQAQHHWQPFSPPAPAGFTPGRQHCFDAAAGPASPQPLSGLVGQLQASVARLQQQLGASQQQCSMQQGQPVDATSFPAMANRVMQAGCAHSVCTVSAGGRSTGQQEGCVLLQQQHHHRHRHHGLPTQQPLAQQQASRHRSRHDAGSHSSTILPATQPPGCGRQRKDASGDGTADSTCSSDDGSGSTISCSAELAAAVAAARQRLRQQERPAGRQPVATGGRQEAAAPSASSRGPRSPHHAADLAALASATLQKLEQLSTEDMWC